MEEMEGKIKLMKNKSNSESESGQNFYNLPDKKSNRCTSLGLGTRTDFSKLNNNICGKYYDLRSQFDIKNTTGISFGISKEHYKKVFVRNDLVKDEENPGPARYDVRNKIGKDAPKFSFYSKIDSQSLFNLTVKSKKNPGPGYYNLPPSINSNGKIANSNYKNINAFGFGKEKRFKIRTIQDDLTPIYDVTHRFNGTGKSFLSNFKSNNAISFSKRFKEKPIKFICNFSS
jgi:hypothetical protein